MCESGAGRDGDGVSCVSIDQLEANEILHWKSFLGGGWMRRWCGFLISRLV